MANPNDPRTLPTMIAVLSGPRLSWPGSPPVHVVNSPATPQSANVHTAQTKKGGNK